MRPKDRNPTKIRSQKENSMKTSVNPMQITRYVGKCSSVGHDVRFERVVMVRGVYFYDIDVGRQEFS